MKYGYLKSAYVFFLLPLQLQMPLVMAENRAHETLTNAYCIPKTDRVVSDIYLDDQYNIFENSRAFNDSFIKVNADQNADMRMTGSVTLLGLVKLPSTAKKSLNNALTLVIDATTGSVGISSASANSTKGGIVHFSSGSIISGASILPTTPRLLGFGNSIAETVNGSGDSTVPSEVNGYSFIVPFSGTISNLQVSTDLFVNTATLLNSTGVQYNYTILVSPSSSNSGTDHVASAYTATILAAATSFGALSGTTIVSSTFRTCTKLNTGSVSVNAGDRIAVRVSMVTSGNTITDGLIAAQISQASFAASLNYTPS